MATINGQVQVLTTLIESVANGFGGTVEYRGAAKLLRTAWDTTLTAGIADAVDVMAEVTLSLAGSATTVDLTALVDRYNVTRNFARVCGLMAVNLSTTDTHTVEIAPGASNGWTAWVGASSTVKLFPSTSSSPGFVLWTAPNTAAAATSGTNKTLKFDPGANTITVALWVWGRSA